MFCSLSLLKITKRLLPTSKLKQFSFKSGTFHLLTKMEKPLKLEIVAEFNKARASKMTLPHGEVLTPVYMPVGTKAAMKGLLSCDMERMGCKLMLSNTYHLTKLQIVFEYHLLNNFPVLVKPVY